MRAFDVWGMQELKCFRPNIRKEALTQTQSNAVSPLCCFKEGQRFVKTRGPWERLNKHACLLRCLTKGSTFSAHIHLPMAFLSLKPETTLLGLVAFLKWNAVASDGRLLSHGIESLFCKRSPVHVRKHTSFLLLVCLSLQEFVSNLNRWVELYFLSDSSLTIERPCDGRFYGSTWKGHWVKLFNQPLVLTLLWWWEVDIIDLNSVDLKWTLYLR